MGISVPARTPAEIIARLNSEIAKILATPEARDWLATHGAQPGSGTPVEFGAYIKAEHSRWGPIIRKAGIRPIEAERARISDTVWSRVCCCAWTA
jgi:tripartite-type tricarboxylate transporter receptor subunit TctC